MAHLLIHHLASGKAIQRMANQSSMQDKHSSDTGELLTWTSLQLQAGRQARGCDTSWQ